MKPKIIKIITYLFFIFFINIVSIGMFKLILNFNIPSNSKNYTLDIDLDDMYDDLDEDNDITDKVEELPRTRSYSTRNKSLIEGIIIHHTASDTTATPEYIAQIGIDRFGVGHSYHYQILRSGEIVKTNYVYSKTAQLANHNSTTIGIVVTGNYSNYDITNTQLIQIIRLGRMLKKIIPSITYVKCHRDFDATNCPGDYIYKRMEYIEEKILENN